MVCELRFCLGSDLIYGCHCNVRVHCAGLTQDDVEEARYSPEREMFASLQDAIVHQHNLAFVGKHGESLVIYCIVNTG